MTRITGILREDTYTFFYHIPLSSSENEKKRFR